MTESHRRIASRMSGVAESATLKLNSRVTELKKQGVDVINLSTGEPDFSVPDAAKKAAIAAINSDKSKYTPVTGIPELRQAVADKTNAQHGLEIPWKASDVVVSNGGKQALINTFLCLLNDGDEVLIPAPYWLSYPAMVKIAGGTPVIMDTTERDCFKITPSALKKALGPRTRAIIINTPSNPTGAVYSKDELRAIADVLQEHPNGRQVIVVSDEIYDRIVFGEVPFCSFLRAAPEFRDRTVTINGMSKSAAMTGWRIGWTVCAPWLSGPITCLQGQATSNINSVAQWASIAALKMAESEFKQQIDRFRNRRDLCLEILKNKGKMEIVSPSGAFYVFAGVGRWLRAGEDSIGFAERLLDEARVALVPGTLFGAAEFVRLSFATDEETLEEGCRRIASYLIDARR